MNPFLFRRIRGPVFLLCFALTAILSQWHILPFWQSWPLYLITAGILRIVEGLVLVAVPFAGYPQVGWPRRRSLTGGIVLLGIGVIALLVTTGLLPSFEFWSGYAVWWPLLLVLLGVLLLVERLLDRGFYARRYPNGAQVPYRRHHGGGLVSLVILLVVLGALSHHHHFVWSDNQDWNWPNDWNFNFGGETYVNDVTLAQAIPSNATLSIEDGRGDVQIAPSTDGMIHIQAHQTAHVPERRKDGAFAGTRPQLSVHGSAAEVTVPQERGVDVRLQVQVPSTVRCTIHTSRGDVAVSGSQQPVEITDDHGDVTLDSLGAGAHLAMDHGDLQARSVAGDIVVDGRADDINLSGIGGKAVLHGEFFGDTELDAIQGAVEFRSARTDLDLGKLTGSLSLDSDNLRLSGASGGVRVTTRSKDVEADGVTGDAAITDSNGDIHMLAQPPLGALTLTDSTGDITLRLPATAAFALSGQTNTDDTIESDWGLVQSTQGDSKTIRGQVGHGGPQIVLRTDHGDLTLRRASADADRPEQPERPAHLPHLHTAAPPAPPTVQ